VTTSFQSHKRWKQITAEIQEKGMSTELDERANKFLVNCRTKTDIETQRKPITAFLTLSANSSLR
jgi:hypothetical protein